MIIVDRDHYRLLFDDFDPRKVARYSARKIDSLLADPGIVRNRLKVESTVTNAKAYLRIQEEHGSFDAWLWRRMAEVPASTASSNALSKALRQRGFRFVGPTICYAFMQAVGLVNDHLTGCFRHHEISNR